MSTSPADTVVLCEDLQQEVFIRRFLKQRGWHHRSIVAKKAGPGKGSAEQWVRNEYPRELRAFRSRSARALTFLIVVLDVDAGTVAGHAKELERACQQADVSPRSSGERVVFILPKRNIETWLAFLRDVDVDESTLYPRYRFQSECQAEVLRLDEMCRRQDLSANAPPSLVSACTEYRRLQAGSQHADQRAPR